MNNTFTMSARLCTLLLILLFYSTTYADSAKVDVCHIPPDDPESFHTIRINEKALPAHLAHGDFAGACNTDCAVLCNDDNACTVDDILYCEEQGCPTFPRETVDCSDGLACTDDSCDVEDGCGNEPVECVPTDLCHVSMCAEPGGECAETPVVCADDEVCDLGTGNCVPDGPVTVCPCWVPDELLSVTAENQNGNSCSDSDPGILIIQNIEGSTPGVEGGFAVMDQSCITRDFFSNVPITLEESAVCVQQISDRCAAIGDPVSSDFELTASPSEDYYTDPGSVFD